MCSLLTAAVYFGGLIEQLQKTARKLNPSEDGGLLKAKEWESLKSQLLDVLGPAQIDPAMKKIIGNKIRGLNQLPNNVALERLFQQLGSGSLKQKRPLGNIAIMPRTATHPPIMKL